MSKNDMPDKQADRDKEKELRQIEDWLDELPEFDDREYTASTYEELLCLIEKSRNDNGLIDKTIVDRIIDVLSHETTIDHIDSLLDFLKEFRADSSDYSMLGMSAYKARNYVVAERAYRLAVKICDEDYLITGYKNNLAYLIRRKEVEKPEKRIKKEVPILLREGVAKKDTFSLINMALFWALECGNEENWDLADKLVSYVNRSDVTGALEWWKDVALADEVEGYLVHLFLIRHGKVDSSSLGNMDELFKRVKKEYPGIPEKMKSIVTPFDGGMWDDFPTFPLVDWN